jgi:hypothetical protein
MVRTLTAVVLVFAAASAASAQPTLTADEALAKRIREANARATRAIAAKLPSLRRGDSTYDQHAQTLIALALLRAGGPAERETARQLLDRWWHDALRGQVGGADAPGRYANYVLALGISALEGLTLEPIVDEEGSTLTRYRRSPATSELKAKLDIAVRTLLDSRIKGGGMAAFGYEVCPLSTGDTRAAPEVSPRIPGNEADLSNTQFSLLALHDAARGGVAIPGEVVNELAAYLLSGDPGADDGGAPLRWGYHPGGSRSSSVAMTFAGLSSLAVVRDLGFKDPALDGTIGRGLLRLGELANACGALGPATHGFGTAYNLYSLEKALDLLEVPTLDGKDWFAPLAEKVLKAQEKSGLWCEGDVIDSCFTVLFLVRATLSESRIGPPRTVIRRGTRAAGMVLIPRTQEIVDVPGLVRAFAEATDNVTIARARRVADEAVHALAEVGSGEDAILLGPLEKLLGGRNSRRETAARWSRDLAGRELTPAEAKDAGALYEKIILGKEVADLRAALAKESPLPLQALAATAVAAREVTELAPVVIEAADRLASEACLETPAGSRCARAFAAALGRLIFAAKGVAKSDELPALPATGHVSEGELEGLVRAARARLPEVVRRK